MAQIFSQLNWWSAIDILLIAIIIYYFLLLIKGTRAAQMLIGIAVIIIIFFISSKFPISAVNWVLNKFYSSIILILIILFQDDIRHALHRIGKRSFLSAPSERSSKSSVDEIASTAFTLSRKRIGALIVIERTIVLNRYINIGINLDASISKELLLSIFQPSTPLHDGATVIQNERIAAASCFLPLIRGDSFDAHLGTRHRAALGISHETDALVVIVSEETGRVALIFDDHMNAQKDEHEMRRLLIRHLVDKQRYLGINKKADS